MTGPLVRHPEDGRWGVFLPMSLLEEWTLSGLCEPRINLSARRTYPERGDCLEDGQPLLPQTKEFLRAAEFNPDAPHEAILMHVPEGGWAFFYLPPDPA